MTERKVSFDYEVDLTELTKLLNEAFNQTEQLKETLEKIKEVRIRVF